MFVVVCTVILVGILVFQTGTATEAQTRNLFELKESPRARPEAEKSSLATLRESEIDI